MHRSFHVWLADLLLTEKKILKTLNARTKVIKIEQKEKMYYGEDQERSLN
jgi:hypothetical protein